MKVTFCLPTHNYKSPIGGFKIVYEYSNYLVKRGIEVSIVFCTENSLLKYNLPRNLRFFLAKIIVYLSPKWFYLDKKIKKIAAPDLNDKYVPDSDVVVATAVKTAYKVKQLSCTKGKKYYLIQDFENWEVNNDIVYESYKLGLNNIVVSTWLFDIVKKYSNNVKCIKNPIDLNVYRVITPINKRSPLVIGMLYHNGKYKGTKYSIMVLENVKKIYPDLQVIAFGNPKRPKNLPTWFEYHQNAKSYEVAKIYNRCSIFICSSIIEGYGLTGLESMACGCAFVSSGYKGVYEYATDKVNALICPVKDVERMTNSIIYLLENNDYRIKIGEKAADSVKFFSWNNAVTNLLKYFENGNCNGGINE